MLERRVLERFYCIALYLRRLGFLSQPPEDLSHSLDLELHDFSRRNKALYPGLYPGPCSSMKLAEEDWHMPIESSQ